jgi:hypothetical protein
MGVRSATIQDLNVYRLSEHNHTQVEAEIDLKIESNNVTVISVSGLSSSLLHTLATLRHRI